MIRPASTQDIDWMIAAGDLATEEAPFFRGMERDYAEQANALGRMLFIPELVCVRVVGDQTGFLIGSLEPTLWFKARFAVQNLLWVHPEKRGSWRAWRLIAAFEQWAREQGAMKVVMATDSGVAPEKTERLYKKMGYTVTGVQSIKEL